MCSDQTQADTLAYHRDGYAAMPELFPVEVLHTFYARLQGDFAAAGRPLQTFKARSPLLRHEAIEVYGHQYLPMLTFLWGLTPAMAKVTGRVLLPTYAYFRLYRGGDVCRIHTDRMACEHSLSLTIAYADDKPWSLSVGAQEIAEPQAVVTDDFAGQPFGSVAMRPGDGVAYQGTHRRHGRLDPNPNAWSAHLFLHWVERNGRYADQAFDRPALERAHAQSLTTRSAGPAGR